MTSKQRKNLQAIASNLQPIGQIGKGGLSDPMLQSFSDALDKRELIKISVLQNAELSAKEYGFRLADALRAECVIAIGRKVVLYRRSTRDDITHLEF